VRQNLLLGVKEHAPDRPLVDGRHVRHVPLPARARRHAGGVLSGGEQQMLTICRTLMGDPT
jgi:branched-chain amino acid transport system ATP-binding protein